MPSERAEKERMVGVVGSQIVREREGCTEAETRSLVKIQLSKAGSKVDIEAGHHLESVNCNN
jgi:hypothetical protein